MITIIEIIIKMIAGILREIFDFIQFSILLHSQSKKYGGKFTPSSKILRRRNKGYSLGAYNSMDIKTSFKHLLVSAPSGIGKSTSVCIPSLVNLHGNGSIIILDPAKEIYKSVGHLYQDYKSYVINFSDREGNESDGWNLLPANVADLPNFTDRISNLVHGTSKDKFWQIQSAELLTTLAEPLYKLDKKYRTIANLLLLLNNLSANEELCNKFMAKYQRPCCILTRVEENESYTCWDENDSDYGASLCHVNVSYQGSARGCDKVGITEFKDRNGGYKTEDLQQELRQFLQLA